MEHSLMSMSVPFERSHTYMLKSSSELSQTACGHPGNFLFTCTMSMSLPFFILFFCQRDVTDGMHVVAVREGPILHLAFCQRHVTDGMRSPCDFPVDVSCQNRMYNSFSKMSELVCSHCGKFLLMYTMSKSFPFKSNRTHILNSISVMSQLE